MPPSKPATRAPRRIKATLEERLNPVTVDHTPPSQSSITSCASWPIASAADIASLFAPDGFIGWYNALLAADSAFKHRGKISTSNEKDFERFWDQAPLSFSRPSVTAVEFCALIAISIEETSGAVGAWPEGCNPPPPHPYPELAYYFDVIPGGVKASYNTLATMGNVSVAKLLTNADFMAAHGARPGGSLVADAPVDKAWSSDTWPTAMVKDKKTGKNRLKFPTTPTEIVNGFLMSADFCKFRGRGVVQTTGRDGYVRVIKFLLENAQLPELSNLKSLVKSWVGAAQPPYSAAFLDRLATISTNDDWQAIFSEPVILAFALADDSAHSGKYLELSYDQKILNADKSISHSLKHMVRKINPGKDYAKEVPPMMYTLINTVAQVIAAKQPTRRLSRFPSEA